MARGVNCLRPDHSRTNQLSKKIAEGSVPNKPLRRGLTPEHHLRGSDRFLPPRVTVTRAGGDGQRWFCFYTKDNKNQHTTSDPPIVGSTALLAFYVFRPPVSPQPRLASAGRIDGPTEDLALLARKNLTRERISDVAFPRADRGLDKNLHVAGMTPTFYHHRQNTHILL